jgi:hypothetical protein
MKSKIRQIIDTLKEGQEITIILHDGQQMCGLYAGTDGDEQVILRSRSGNTPPLGWHFDDIDDIVCKDFEPAGDVVKIDVVDVKTGRKVAIMLDLSGEEGKCSVEFIPTVNCDENGLYVNVASRFMELLTK